MTLYQTLVAAGCVLDNHESDLYVKATPAAEKILRQSTMGWSRFISQTDGQCWFDVPFAYDPWWEARAQ